MLKRLTWLGVGFVAGLGSSKWLELKARRRLARYLPGGRLPDKPSAAALEAARALAVSALGQLGQAVHEGRRAMADREVELREDLRRPPERRLYPVPSGPGAGSLRSALTTVARPGRPQERASYQEHGAGR